MRKLGPKVWLAILGVVLALGITCCQFRGSWSAGLIDNVLKSQPGVTFVTHTVSSNSGFGVRTADFQVMVGPEATADQLSALGRTFADQIHGSMVYGGLGANLHVSRSSESFPDQSGATMYVSVDPSKTTPEPPWQDWLKLSQGDYAYAITGSASPDGPWQSARTGLTVTLRSYDHVHAPLGASEFAASVRRLIADFPDSTTDWTIVDADSNNAPSIRSDHGLPTAEQLTLWEALDQLAPTKGLFDLEQPRFSIGGAPVGSERDRIVGGQLQLIKDSGVPAVYELESEHVTVRPGGCSKDVQEPQPRMPADERLQTKLRAQFESCPR
ncbi:hypothetical protein A5792_23125 [Mycolicibacterium peregrinum]|uniref:Uncharacterized protein n=1 Tax=Mycolicibacterium peregrinum TaxID=43304 RepID=A0A1A0R017_MYCPR|nr:hypothetical protein [Mycolicibacterium peregrinum]OBB27746.1 hypothetical protein A5792_23125 [Mycolicibacterium peregrinum]